MKSQRPNNLKTNGNPLVYLMNRGILCLIILPLFQPVLYAQTWSLNASAAYSNGKYIYDKAIENYYFNLGLNFNDFTKGYNLSISVPFILQKSDLNSGSSGMQTMNENGPTVNSGISDVYFYGEYVLLKTGELLPEIAFKTQLKIPTGAGNSLFSSGKFDFGGGIAIKKM